MKNQPMTSDELGVRLLKVLGLEGQHITDIAIKLSANILVTIDITKEIRVEDGLGMFLEKELTSYKLVKIEED